MLANASFVGSYREPEAMYPPPLKPPPDEHVASRPDGNVARAGAGEVGSRVPGVAGGIETAGGADPRDTVVAALEHHPVPRPDCLVIPAAGRGVRRAGRLPTVRRGTVAAAARKGRRSVGSAAPDDHLRPRPGCNVGRAWRRGTRRGHRRPRVGLRIVDPTASESARDAVPPAPEDQARAVPDAGEVATRGGKIGTPRGRVQVDAVGSKRAPVASAPTWS
jgi:hypothetical protein